MKLSELRRVPEIIGMGAIPIPVRSSFYPQLTQEGLVSHITDQLQLDIAGFKGILQLRNPFEDWTSISPQDLADEIEHFSQSAFSLLKQSDVSRYINGFSYNFYRGQHIGKSPILWMAEWKIHMTQRQGDGRAVFNPGGGLNQWSFNQIKGEFPIHRRLNMRQIADR